MLQMGVEKGEIAQTLWEREKTLFTSIFISLFLEKNRDIDIALSLSSSLAAACKNFDIL